VTIVAIVLLVWCTAALLLGLALGPLLRYATTGLEGQAGHADNTLEGPVPADDARAPRRSAQRRPDETRRRSRPPAGPTGGRDLLPQTARRLELITGVGHARPESS
jgi:hypothetical protein